MPFLQNNGTCHYYRVDGEGPPLLILSGWTQPLFSWFLQVRELKDRFQVVRIDNRGAGLSSAPTGPYTMEEMAADAARLLDHLEVEKCHVVGVSMGGMIAQHFALDHPKRVDRMVLISTAAHVERPRQLATMTRWAHDAIAFGAPAGLRGFFGQMGAIAHHDTRRRLKEIRRPTLVMVGENDTLTPVPWSEHLAGGIPKSKLVVVPGTTHLMVIEKWRECNRQIIDFLTAKAH